MNSLERTQNIKSLQKSKKTTNLSLPAKLLIKVLEQIKFGQLVITWTDGRQFIFQGKKDGLKGEMVIKDSSILKKLFLSGAIGFAESYIEGKWDTPDLPQLLENIQGNMETFRSYLRIPAPLRPIQRLGHMFNTNSLQGARRNISYHYDLGNDFYALWLDPSMTYSCGIFDKAEYNLERAQRKKWDKILSIANVTSKDRVLEIGCGWGGLAVYAAKKIGCQVTALTISEEQHDWARQRVRDEGIESLVKIKLQDYRKIEESFDKIISVEMLEAVGEKYWPAFFNILRSRLRQKGMVAIQSIIINEQRYLAYRRQPDFIQKYIFPGGVLPSLQLFKKFTQKAGFKMDKPEFYAEDYIQTIHCWLDKFEKARHKIDSLGFDQKFERMWRYYFAYCLAGFRTGNIDVMQVAMQL